MLKDGYNSEIYFHIPGAFKKKGLIQGLVTLYKTSNYVFYNNAKIGSLYGSPECIWNGGRVVKGGNPITIKDAEKYRDQINNSGIPIRFTFTNCLIEDRHIYDDYGNFLLKIFANKKNQILCNKSVLENYIKKMYGDEYKYISSTTKVILNPEDLEKEIDKYFMTVIDFRFNKNLPFLKSLRHPEKLEVLCNAVCDPKCKVRSKHYENLSRCQMLSITEDIYNCSCMALSYGEIKKNHPMYISPDMINDIYIPLGIKNFKIEGRTSPRYDNVEALVDYLIKDEYKMEIREFLLASSYNSYDINNDDD